MSSQTVSMASSLLQPSRSEATRLTPSTIHVAVPARCAPICSATCSSPRSFAAPSKTARTSPAERAWAAATTPATTDKNSSALRALRASPTPAAIEDRHRLVVAGDRHIDRRLQQPGLRAEQRLHRRDRHLRPGRDHPDGGAPVPTIKEHPRGRFQPPPPRPTPLGLPPARTVP